VIGYKGLVERRGGFCETPFFLTKGHEEMSGDIEADSDAARPLRRERDFELRQQRLEAEERIVCEKLAEIGVNIDSIEELKKKACWSPKSVQVVLDLIPEMKEENIQEALIRVLAVPVKSYSGEKLVQYFSETCSPNIKWVIANTIYSAQPTGISDWVVSAVQNPDYGYTREMLILALPKLVPASRAIPVLLSVLQQIPGHTAMALGRVGGMNELKVLETYEEALKPWERKEFDRAIKKIKKRLG
jgi:hypothetical protein